MADELKLDEKEDFRQNLVDTAVSFLQNPNVKQRPDDAKIAFLKKKGLTDSEITEAFSRVKYEAGTALVASEDEQLVNAYPLPPYQTSSSFWFHLKHYSSTFVGFAFTVYALHRLYKSYIEPWLFGSQNSELSDLKQQLIELNNSVSSLTSTVASLEETVNNQICQRDTSSLHDVESVPKSVRDILDEVSNVKGLLLNRFSFPAPPVVGGASTENKLQMGDSKTSMKLVTIPKWQLRDSEIPKEQVEVIENKGDSSVSTSLKNNFSSLGNEENNVKITKDKFQNKDSNTTLQNKKANLENNLSKNDKILDEESKIFLQKGGSDMEEKTPDEDSGIESHNFLSDSELTYQASGKNDSESIKNSK